MSVTPFLLALTAIINVWIGFNVYRLGPRLTQNRAFAFLALTIGIWSASVTLSHYGIVGHLWAARFAFASGILIPFGVLRFILALRVDLPVYDRIHKFFFIPMGVILFVLSLSPLVVVSVTPQPVGSGAVYGPLHPTFAIYFIFSLAYCIYLLAEKYRTSTGVLRVQIRYLALAFGIPGALAVTTNLVVPVLFKNTSFTRYGPFFSLLVLVLIGHAIIRHRLMDMRVVIKRSVVYLAAFSAAGLILVTLLLASD